MKQYQQRYGLILWFGMGIIVSTIAANRLFASGVVNYQMLHQYVQRGWDVGQQKNMWVSVKTILVRILETAAIYLVCKRGFRHLAVWGLLFLAGVGGGLSITLMTWNYGLRGILVSFLSWLPHYLCYLSAWGMMILPGYFGYEVRKGRYLSVIIGFTAMGIVAEILVHPLLLIFI